MIKKFILTENGLKLFSEFSWRKHIFDNNGKHESYAENYSMPNMSNNCRGENTSTFVCSFNPLSPENIPQLYFNARAILVSSVNSCASSSVNLDLETMRFNLANSSNSSLSFLATSNCQLIFFINASSFNSSGNFIDISSISNTTDLDYINISDYELISLTSTRVKVNYRKGLYFLDSNNESVKIKIAKIFGSLLWFLRELEKIKDFSRVLNNDIFLILGWNNPEEKEIYYSLAVKNKLNSGAAA